MGLNYILVMILGSLTFMLPMINKKQNPYKIVFYSTISSWMGILILFCLMYYTGSDIGSQIKESIDVMVDNLSKDKRFLELVSTNYGTSQVDKETIKTILNVGIVVIPSVLMILGNVISVLLYKILWNIFYKHKKGVKNFLIKEYHLSHRSLVCWIAIYIISYLIGRSGYDSGEIVAINIEIVIRLLLLIEGALALVDIGYKYKNYRRSLMYIVAFVIYLIPYGTLILVMLGVISSIYNIRQKDLVKKLKG